MKKAKTIVVTWLIGLVMVMAIGGWACDDARDAEDTTPLIMPGSKVILRYRDNPTTDICGAVDDEAWDAMQKGLAANDEIGLAALVVTGRMLLIKPGTRALVIDDGWTSFEVRLLSGRYMGQTAWVLRKAVSAEQAAETADKTPDVFSVDASQE